MKTSIRKQRLKYPLQMWWLCVGILVCCTFIAFFPCLQNGFVNYDDTVYVYENPYIQSLSSENLQRFFTKPMAHNYHPLTMLSLAVNYQFSGLNPFGYHLTNLLLHLANVIWVFWLVYWLGGKRLELSIIVSLLFGIHPMHVESVAWVAERKDVLYAFFFLPALIAYIRYIKTRKGVFFVGALLLFLLALLSKPAAIILPVLLLLLDYWYKRSLWSIKVIIEKIPFFLLALLFSYWTLEAQKAEGAVVAMGAYPPFTRFMAACYGFSMYIIKMFVPHQLTVYYPYPYGDFPPIYYVFPVLSVLIGGVILYSLRFTRAVFFGMVFYLINLLLVLQIVTVGGTIMSERYTYIPYIGLFFIVAWGCLRLITKWKQLRTTILIGLAVYSLILGIFTWNRCEVWKDSMSLWSDSISKIPNVIAYNNRGELYFNQQRYDLALEDVGAAIVLNPAYMQSRQNRGLIHSVTNQFEKAIEDYTVFLQNTKSLKRRHPVLNWRGIAYLSLNRYETALRDFNEAIGTFENDGTYYFNRSRTHRALGNRVEALKDAQKAKSLGIPVDSQYIEGLR